MLINARLKITIQSNSLYEKQQIFIAQSTQIDFERLMDIDKYYVLITASTVI